jgi:hypothetical protein
MTTNTTQSVAGSGALEARGLVPFVNDLQPRCPKCPRGSVAQALLPVRFCCARAQEMAHIAASLPCISPDFTPFTLPHPRKPFLATRHSLAQRRNTADEGPLVTEILIANPELEFRLTHRKLSQLKISNRKKIAIFHPIFRRSTKTVLPPSFPKGNGFRALRVSGFWSPRSVRHGRSCGTVDSTGILPPDTTTLSGICARCIPVASSGPSANDPLACPEARREPLEGRGFIPSVKSPELRSTPLALIDLRNSLPRFASPGFTPLALTHPRNLLTPCASDEPTPLAQPHPRKPFVVFLPSKKNVTLTCPLPLALIHLRNPLRRFASLEFTPFAQPNPRKPFLITSDSLLATEILIANARLEFT